MSKTSSPLVFLVAALLLGACMDDIHDYDHCLDIEDARCARRDACLGSSEEFDSRFKGFDLDTCEAYAREHCRTRELQGDDDPAPETVQACLNAISQVPCAEIYKDEDETEDIPACEFIEEPEEEEGDAGTS